MINNMTREQKKQRTSPTIDLAYIAVFATLIILLGIVAIPVGALGVPIVLQNSAILLTGLLLGGRRAGLAAALFLAVGLIGIPNLAGGNTTLKALSGVTIGYLVGYLISAYVTGSIAQRAPWRTSTRALVYTLAGVIGLSIQYLCGSIGLIIRANMTFTEALTANTPFIASDLAETAIAIVIAISVSKAVPDLLPHKN